MARPANTGERRSRKAGFAMAARSLGGQAAVWWERRLSDSGSTVLNGSSVQGSCLQGSKFRDSA